MALVIVACHQPNFLPGVSVVEKILQADAVIWLDEVAYSNGGYTNRNRLPDGSWFTIPVSRHGLGTPINRVMIGIGATREWREQAADRLVNAFGAAAIPAAIEIMRPYRRLVALNAAILRVLFTTFDPTIGQHWQSHLIGGSLRDPSERLAAMVAEIGGTVYLSGPSGRKYLNEQPFDDRGIEVRYYEHDGPNPCALSLLTAERGAVAA